MQSVTLSSLFFSFHEAHLTFDKLHNLFLGHEHMLDHQANQLATAYKANLAFNISFSSKIFGPKQF